MLNFNVIRRLLSYRRKDKVRDLRMFGDDVYPLCPRCRCIIEREFTKFCVNCEQHLGWSFFRTLYKSCDDD